MMLGLVRLLICSLAVASLNACNVGTGSTRETLVCRGPEADHSTIIRFDSRMLTWETSSGVQIFDITSIDPMSIDATEHDPQGATSSLHLDRTTGQATWTTRVVEASIPLLLRACAGSVSHDECVEEMREIPGGNIFACTPDSQMCETFSRGENTLRQFPMTCARQQF